MIKNMQKIIDFTRLLPNGKSFFTEIESFSNDENYTSLVNFLLDNGTDQNEVYLLGHAILIQSLCFVDAYYL